MLNLINLVLGATLLVAGRKMFWLFVGAAGFVTGLQLATRFSQGPGLPALLVGLGVGAIFALLAIFLQALVIGIAGFLIGGYVFTMLAAILGIDLAGVTIWIVYLLGGLIGLALVKFLFDWAVVTLSSLAGASLVFQALSLQGAGGGILFLLLFVAGLLVQAAMLRRERASA